MNEKQIESQILTWLNYQKGIFAFKVNTVGVFDPMKKVFRKNKNPFLIPGTSDIIGQVYGQFFAIEVKSTIAYARFMTKPNEKDNLQIAFLTKISDCGGHSLVTCSLDQVIPWIKKIKADLRLP